MQRVPIIADGRIQQYEHMREDAYEYNQQLKSKSNRWIMTDLPRESRVKDGSHIFFDPLHKLSSRLYLDASREASDCNQVCFFVLSLCYPDVLRRSLGDGFVGEPDQRALYLLAT